MKEDKKIKKYKDRMLFALYLSRFSSQRALSIFIGLQPKVVNKAFNRPPRRETLYKIVSALNVDYSWVETGKHPDIDFLLSYELWCCQDDPSLVRRIYGAEYGEDNIEEVLQNPDCYECQRYEFFVEAILSIVDVKKFSDFSAIDFCFNIAIDKSSMYKEFAKSSGIYYDLIMKYKTLGEWQWHIFPTRIDISSSIQFNAMQNLVRTSKGSAAEEGATYSAASLKSVANKCLPVIGAAAADNDQASKAELFAPDNVEEVEVIKEYHQLIRIYGNSMEPVLLNGQYAMIGREILQSEKINKSGWIGVVQVNCDDADFPEAVSCSGGICTFCKQVTPMGDDMLLLTSINPTECQPFTVMRKNILHLWPVSGVFFAGQGIVPED